MKNELKEITNYLNEALTDPIPRYILKKEILQETPTTDEVTAVQSSKWYKQLADEQWDDGSWGRFHSMDSRVAKSQKFVSTEAALRRLRELGLTKDDPIVAKSIAHMERIINGEETWRDCVEKHHDNGKSHLYSRIFLTAADLNLFDPNNPVLEVPRDTCIKQLARAFATGNFDVAVWEQANLDYSGIFLRAEMVYPLLLVQYTDCLDDTLQRQYLNYIWNRENGIYYISHFPVSQKIFVVDKCFKTWLSALEALSGFSLFPEFMKKDIYQHLIGEINRLINENVKFPPAHSITGHYAESWRDKNARKNDMILQIIRILVKCE